mmetsp:Transcript_40663/g.95562  ORF Transcript_40663/g.95562 Transcript_40663/m.95562 type:complete len:229 (+) Transcript_40663:455-1141(+)
MEPGSASFSEAGGGAVPLAGSSSVLSDFDVACRDAGSPPFSETWPPLLLLWGSSGRSDLEEALVPVGGDKVTLSAPDAESLDLLDALLDNGTVVAPPSTLASPPAAFAEELERLEAREALLDKGGWAASVQPCVASLAGSSPEAHFSAAADAWECCESFGSLGGNAKVRVGGVVISSPAAAAASGDSALGAAMPSVLAACLAARNAAGNDASSGAALDMALTLLLGTP